MNGLKASCSQTGFLRTATRVIPDNVATPADSSTDRVRSVRAHPRRMISRSETLRGGSADGVE
jgi:hypothetical protein